MRKSLMRLVVLALPVIGAGGAVAVGLWKAGWPSQTFWRDGFIVGCIIVSGLIPAAQASISELGERKRRKKLEHEDHVRSLLIPALVEAVKHHDAPWDLTGVQAFILTGWWWRRRHVRLAKVRLASSSESGVLWTKGKGVIGRCWETHASILIDLSQPPFSELSNVSQEEWDTVPKQDCFGLSYSDYKTLGSKYGIVVVVPIIRDGTNYMGCVTLDLPPGHGLAKADELMEFLATTADLVRRMVRS
jgi:hypothetical protein